LFDLSATLFELLALQSKVNPKAAGRRALMARSGPVSRTASLAAMEC
jgi:hypothetical protein